MNPELRAQIAETAEAQSSCAESFHRWAHRLKYPIIGSWVFDAGLETWQVTHDQAFEALPIILTGFATLGALAFKSAGAYMAKESAESTAYLLELEDDL